jgi:tRNA threonylcarbamoyladenosine biosynthesis protein TsaB
MEMVPSSQEVLVAEGREILLSIDTATATAGFAICSSHQILAEETWLSTQNHTVELMPRIVATMEKLRVAPTDLRGVAVAQGPGSFTGLRIGMSVGKGLALGLEIPLVGVPTLEITAYPHRFQPLPIKSIIQAGRGRICAASFLPDGGDLRSLYDPCITTIEELCEKTLEPTLFCGEVTEEEKHHILDTIGESAQVGSPALSLRRPGHLAELGWKRLRSEAGADDAPPVEINPASLTPIYLHQPEPKV